MRYSQDRLDALLADDFTAVHITGYEQPRADWLEQVRAGAGESVKREFTVNVRTPALPDGKTVKLNAREVGSKGYHDRAFREGPYPVA